MKQILSGFLNYNGLSKLNIFLFCLSFYFLLYVQVFTQSFPVRSYTVEDGLITNFINDAVQDNNGRMWFATELGVSVYNGCNWINYTPKDGLPVEDYFKILLDKENTIWAIPSDLKDKIAFFKENRWHLIKPPVINNSFSINVNYADLTSVNNHPEICIGTNNGVYIFNQNEWKHITKTNGLLNDTVLSVKHYDDNFYICSSSGLSILNGLNIDNSLNHYFRNYHSYPLAIDFEKTPSGNLIFWLLGKEWIGSLSGKKLHLITKENKMIFNPRNRFIFLLNDKTGRLYYGNEHLKFFIEKTTYKIHPLNIKNGFTTGGSNSIFIDKERNIWFPNSRSIDKVSNLQFQNYYESNGLLENEVTAILEISPGYMIFGHNYGLTILKDNKYKKIDFLSYFNDHSYCRVLDLCKDSSGNIWFTSANMGIGKLKSDNSIKWIKYSNNVQFSSIITDKNGEVWIGSSIGIFKIVNDQLVFQNLLNNQRASVRKLFINDNGEFILATPAGLIIKQKNFIKNIQNLYSKASNNIYSISNYADDKKLIGTAEGIFVLEKDSLKKFTDKTIEINNKVFFILRDKGNNYWFGTNDGVIKWDGRKSKKFSVEHGLSGRETNRSAGIVDSEGRVWIGTDKGLSCYLEEYDQPEKPPITFLLSVEDNEGKAFRLDSINYFRYDRNTLTFYYRGISFINEKLINYRVRLIGFDMDWQDVGSNTSVRYTNLKPGEYKFAFESRLHSGDWSKPVYSSILEIELPYYSRWWFYLALIILFGLPIYLVYSSKVQKKYSLQLEKEVEKRTNELKKSEEKFKSLVENAPDFICSFGKDKKIIFANKYFSNIFNNNLINSNILDFIPEERKSEFENILKNVFDLKRTEIFELKIKKPDGSDLWIENTIGPILSGDPVTEAIVIATDITERKLAGMAKKEIEEYQNAILSFVPVILYSATTPSPYDATWMTKNVKIVTGFSPERFLNEKYFWSSRIHPDDQERVTKEFSVVRKGNKASIEYRWQCADRTFRWFLDNITPRHPNENTNVEYFGIWLDITERKLAEERLESLNRTFLEFSAKPADNINSLVELLGKELNAACALYNRLVDGLLTAVGFWNIPPDYNYSDKPEGHICFDVISGNFQDTCIIRNLENTDYMRTDPNVSKYNLKTYIGKPVSMGGKTIGSLCIVYQEDKEPTNNDLKLLSIISAAIGVEENRDYSNEQLKKSLNEKEILLKEIHHRVKNNLQIISSLLQLQSGSLKDTQHFNIFQESQNRIRSMALVHEKLYQSTDISKINFSDYIKGLVQFLFRSYNISKLGIKLNLNIENYFLSLDTAIPCGLIINELISNSLKYAFPSVEKSESPTVNREIFISLNKNNDGKFILIAGDNGIGLPKMFDPLNNPSTLGLRLVNMLANQINSQIEFDNTKGAKFILTFSDIKEKPNTPPINIGNHTNLSDEDIEE